VVIARESLITAGDLPERVRRAGATLAPESDAPAASAEPSTPPLVGGPDFNLKAEMRRAEVKLIVAALEQVDWNQTHAARLLNIPRRTLVHKMKVLEIRKPHDD